MIELVKEFYNRQELLLKDKQNNLFGKRVAIIGAGGLGSTIAYALGSVGLKEIIIVDFDIVSVSNIQRQIMFSFDDENKFKVDCFKKLENRSYTKITPLVMNASDFFDTYPNVDLIMDATDNVETRLVIDTYAKKNNIAWVYASVEEFFINFGIIKEKEFLFNKEVKRVKPQTTPMVMLSACLASSLALKYLAGYDVKINYVYYFDISKDIINLNKFNL
ncbi:HesA/MoeB/ThiF family protein [Campylobacter sp. MG1]|uniref:HesA/MoeB/ThiF family protein n=1 Tax=Campylobacter sp. MG1 TaxID=2976332 RepID=UPI00226D281F|nr:ThiF family adenylyltransferase [Campylobacter sp. MG1]